MSIDRMSVLIMMSVCLKLILNELKCKIFLRIIEDQFLVFVKEIVLQFEINFCFYYIYLFITILQYYKANVKVLLLKK